MSVQGQQIVVIGGSSGIGLGTAARARAAGAHVTITGRSPERLAEALEVLGDGVSAVALDSSDEAGTRALFEDMPVVHHVFVSAGGVGPGGGLHADTDLSAAAMDTRLWGSVFAAKHAAPRMTEGGSITFCSGTSSLRPRPGGNPVSAASCAAVEALARSLAFELAPIRVNTVIPGMIDTPLVASGLGVHRDAFYEAFGAQLPVRRIGTADDIAHAVLFLMENGYVTGINLTIDGGRMLI